MCACVCAFVCVVKRWIPREIKSKRGSDGQRERESEPLALGSYVPKDELQLWCVRLGRVTNAKRIWTFRHKGGKGSVSHHLDVLVLKIG